MELIKKTTDNKVDIVRAINTTKSLQNFTDTKLTLHGVIIFKEEEEENTVTSLKVSDETGETSAADEADMTDETDMTEEAAETKQKPTAATKKQGIILLIIQLIIYTASGFLASTFYPSTALVYGAVVIGTFIAITYAKKQLGGMSGDIAGYGIVWGEFCGVAMLVFC